jgi:hypothetical protein
MLVTVAALFLLLLVVLPFGISYGLHKWLLDNGGDAVHIQDVDFNVFTGKAAISHLDVTADGRHLLTVPQLELDVDWMPLFSRQVVVRGITLDGVALTIDTDEDGSLRIGGINLPESESGTEAADAEPWGFGLDKLRIVNSRLNYRSPDLELETRLDDLTLTRLTTWASEPAPLEFAGSVNGAAIKLDGQLPPLSSGVGYAGQMSVIGLKLDSFARLAQAAIGGLDGQLTIETRVDVLQSSGKPLTVSQDGMIRTEGLAFERDGRRLAYAGLQWEGTTTLSVPPGEAAMELALRGEVSGDGLAVTMPAEALDLRQGSFLWNGEVTVRGGEPAAVTATGQVKFGEVTADVTDSKIQLARIKGIDVGEFSLQDTGDIAVSDLALTDALFAKESEDSKAPAGGGALAAGTIAVDRLQLTAGNQVAIGTMEWRDVTYFARREADGKMHIVRIIDTLPFANREKTAAADEAGTTTDEPAGAMRLDEIRVTGDSKLLFNDATVKPPFDMRLELTELVIKNIDTAKPGQNSAMLIKGRLDKHSRISVKGTVQPFAERPTLNLDNRFEGIALTQLSPYTVSTLGYELESGHLDAESTLKMNQGQLDGKNQLTIRALEVAPVENESREKLDGQLSVPLGTALSMLRDKNDTIKLDLPISGDIDNPDFDISDVVNTAVSKALKTGSMSFLKVALQPYGALITVAQLAGEAASKVRLQPVVFAPGLTDWEDNTGDYLAKVAGILKERPDVNIKVCGLAVAGDREMLAGQQAAAAAAEKSAGKKADKDAVLPAVTISDEQLLALAGQRAGAVKDHLVSTHGVTASRLVACQPRIDDDDENAPRVELLI